VGTRGLEIGDGLRVPHFPFPGAKLQDRKIATSRVVSPEFARLLPKDVTRKRQTNSQGVEKISLPVGEDPIPCFARTGAWSAGRAGEAEKRYMSAEGTPRGLLLGNSGLFSPI
jgi:hypothetical protein